MTRKVILTGLMVFWAPGTVQQLLIGSTISAAYMSVAIWKRPYAVAFNNRFKIITDASVVLTFNIAVLLHPGTSMPASMRPEIVPADRGRPPAQG